MEDFNILNCAFLLRFDGNGFYFGELKFPRMVRTNESDMSPTRTKDFLLIRFGNISCSFGVDMVILAAEKQFKSNAKPL